MLVASLVGAIGTAAMLAGQSHRITGSFVDWTAVVSTHAGLWWSLRLVVFVGALLVVPDIRRLGDARARAVGAGNLGTRSGVIFAAPAKKPVTFVELVASPPTPAPSAAWGIPSASARNTIDRLCCRGSLSGSE